MGSEKSRVFSSPFDKFKKPVTVEKKEEEKKTEEGSLEKKVPIFL